MANKATCPPSWGVAVTILRALRQMQQKELASAAGIGPAYQSLIENGRRNPSLGVIQRQAQALNVTVEDLARIAADPAKALGVAP